MAAAGWLLCLLSALLANTAFSAEDDDNAIIAGPGDRLLMERCALLQPPVPAALSALLPRRRGGGAGAGPCSGALEQMREIGDDDCPQFFRLFADLVSSCPAERLRDTEWNTTMVDPSDWSNHSLPQLLHAFRHIVEATLKFTDCSWVYVLNFTTHYDERDRTAEIPALLQRYQEHWRQAAHLLSLTVSLISELFVPFAAKLLDKHTNDQQLHGWTEKVKHVRDILHTHFLGLLRDLHSIQEQMQNYKIEEDKNKIGQYIIRLPMAYELLMYRPQYTSFLDDFVAVCEDQLSDASEVFRLADALYSIYAQHWTPRRLKAIINRVRVIGEEWQLQDQSDTMLSVDTECLQLLVGAVDRPRCPLKELPPEASRRRRECRQQLREDLVHRGTHVPVISYLAYTQRARVSLCLLAWMVANSSGICQDIPLTISQSAHDADCYIRNPDVISCPKSNDTDAICYVSRAIMLLKCRDFYIEKPTNRCIVRFHRDGSYSGPSDYSQRGSNLVDTRRTVVYKSSATLKYKNFKIDSLRPLEISFVSLNIIFRVLTAWVYVCLPRLRNLPGKLLLCFQTTGLVQILCSEVAHRMAGALPLRAAVLVDSGLTLLSCLWLNAFCYQMFGYVRHLRLPNHLHPSEASKIFRRQVVYALIPCTIVSAASSALEITSKYYLLYSRIIMVIGISLSIAFNMVCLALIAYMYICTRKSMNQLRIYSYDKSVSKKDVIFMSVKAVILSGIGIIIRIGFHQAEDIAQFVYYVHIATMLQGPVLFVLFVCNGRTLPALRNRVLGWLNPDRISPDLGLCSAAERNLERRANDRRQVAESTV